MTLENCQSWDTGYEEGFRAAIRAAMEVVETEHEFPGDPSPQHLGLMECAGVVLCARAAARAVKKSILQRLRASLGA